MTDDDFLLEAMKGNEAAFAFCKQVVEIASLWDDLVDGDKPFPGEEAINRVMTAALLLPSNPFYRKNVDSLQPLMQQAIINWHIANTLEGQDGVAREIAHVQRYAAADILVYSAALIGGLAWARQVGPKIRLLCQKEALADFEREMRDKYAKETAA